MPVIDPSDGLRACGFPESVTNGGRFGLSCPFEVTVAYIEAAQRVLCEKHVDDGPIIWRMEVEDMTSALRGKEASSFFE